MGSGPGTADRDLAERASRLAGFDITPGQIERWREAGYLTLVRRGLGRGLGVAVAYPASAADHAADLARALKAHSRLSYAALVTFLHGYSPKERALKRDYEAVFNELRHFVDPAGIGDPALVAERASARFARRSSESPQGRLWRERLRSKGRSDEMRPILYEFVRLLVGDVEEGEALPTAAFEATGWGETVKMLNPDQEAMFHDILQKLSIPALQAKVAAASLEELQDARDQVRLVCDTFAPTTVAAPDAEFALALVAIPASLVVGAFTATTLALGLANLFRDVQEQ